VEEFDRWLRQPEDRDIEFKKAELRIRQGKIKFSGPSKSGYWELTN
jgi:hypothetical protein